MKTFFSFLLLFSWVVIAQPPSNNAKDEQNSQTKETFEKRKTEDAKQETKPPKEKHLKEKQAKAKPSKKHIPKWEKAE